MSADPRFVLTLFCPGPLEGGEASQSLKAEVYLRQIIKGLPPEQYELKVASRLSQVPQEYKDKLAEGTPALLVESKQGERRFFKSLADGRQIRQFFQIAGKYDVE